MNRWFEQRVPILPDFANQTYPHHRDGLAMIATHPKNRNEIILLLAGNSALETVRLANFDPEATTWHIAHQGKMIHSGF
jgi:hypothetical protein